MLLVQIVQHRENAAGHRRRGIKKLVFDGGIQIGICLLLHGLIDREEAAQHIGRVGTGFIQTHSQYLLWAIRMWIFQIICFQNRRAAPGNLPLRADTQQHRRQQRRRIGPAGEDCPRRRTRHGGRGGFIRGVGVHRLPQERPQGEHSRRGVGRTHNLQPLVVRVDVLASARRSCPAGRSARRPAPHWAPAPEHRRADPGRRPGPRRAAPPPAAGAPRGDRYSSAPAFPRRSSAASANA